MKTQREYECYYGICPRLKTVVHTSIFYSKYSEYKIEVRICWSMDTPRHLDKVLGTNRGVANDAPASP
jgi:hypothetical protein